MPVIEKIREALRKPFDLHGHEVTVTASIGITIYPGRRRATRDTLIKYADTAMYRAKEAGRDAFRFFTAEMNAQSLARLDLENALRRAHRQRRIRAVLPAQGAHRLAAASAAPRR